MLGFGGGPDDTQGERGEERADITGETRCRDAVQFSSAFGRNAPRRARTFRHVRSRYAYHKLAVVIGAVARRRACPPMCWRASRVLVSGSDPAEASLRAFSTSSR